VLPKISDLHIPIPVQQNIIEIPEIEEKAMKMQVNAVWIHNLDSDVEDYYRSL
jgi:hypothetical protein